MKFKFILLTSLLLITRGSDFYSTSLWFFENPSHETNPLTGFFGFGWTGLIIVNILIVVLVIYAFYYYSFKYSMGVISTKPEKLTDFISELYYNEKGKFYQVFYKIPKNKRVLFAHSGYILIRVIIVGSFLATTHNLCQFYELSLYDHFNQSIKRPSYVIYSMIVFSFGYFSYSLWKKEFELSKKTAQTIENRKNPISS